MLEGKKGAQAGRHAQVTGAPRKKVSLVGIHTRMHIYICMYIYAATKTLPTLRLQGGVNRPPALKGQSAPALLLAPRDFWRLYHRPSVSFYGGGKGWNLDRVA